MTDPDRYVNTVRACALTGVSRRSIYYWIKAGDVRSVDSGHGTMVRLSDVIARSQKRTRRPVAAPQPGTEDQGAAT
jgi:predicted site-specific integrase-resolvase